MFRKLTPLRMAVAGLGIAAGLETASAQTFSFSAQDYGKDVLLLNESLGGASAAIARGNTFEPMGQLPLSDPLREAAQAIGRIDVLARKDGKEGGYTCTGTLVAPDVVMTNHHCLPAAGAATSTQVLKASILFFYTSNDAQGAQRVVLDAVPFEADARLDYALVRVRGAIPDGVTPLALAPSEVNPNERLVIVHHPAGQIQMMTQFRCRAARSHTPQEATLRHVCDTLPGSSGAIIFNARLQAVGLHHSGGLLKTDPDSFNRASETADLLRESQTLARLSSGPGTGAPPAQSRPVAGAVNADRTSGTTTRRTNDPFAALGLSDPMPGFEAGGAGAAAAGAPRATSGAGTQEDQNRGNDLSPLNDATLTDMINN